MPPRTIAIEQARRIALAAQGFDRPRPGSTVNAGHIRNVIRRLKLLQIDFVNVLVPAHQMVVFSRLGPYEPTCFDRAVYRDGHFTEQWAHEASIVPIDLWPILEHRRQDWRPYPQSPIMRLRNRSKYLEQVINLIRDNGSVTSQDLPPVPGPARRPGDWHRSVPRWALEYHFGGGQLAVRERLANFQRVYDLPERVVPDRYREQRVDREEAQRELLRRSAAACGIGTLQDLADYFRMSPRDAAPRVEELVEAGELEVVDVAGWRAPAYRHSAARSPRRIRGARLLSPFDPLIWYRPRTERLFEFHYRIEIYVPANKRRWGYYVLPFLLDEQVVARVDLKADRQSGILRVQAAHEEEGIDRDRTAEALASELRLLADWLGLESIRVGRRGSFAKALAAAVRVVQ